MTTTGELWATHEDDDHAEPIGQVSDIEWPWNLDETLRYLKEIRSRGGTWEGLHWWRDDEGGFRSHLRINNPQATIPIEGDHA